jgi:hypothetical protein
MGRTGRIGKLGEYRMVPNLADPDCPLNGKTYNIHNEVSRAQKEMALKAIFEEEVSSLYADFEENITQHFLTDFAGQAEAKKMECLLAWQDFLKTLQNDWNFKKESLLQAVNADNEAAKTSFGESKEAYNKDRINTAFVAMRHHKGFFKPERKQLVVSDKYDPSHDGQACIYSSFFAQELAVLRGERPLFADFIAWIEGRGELFPDLMATLRGERPLFATLRATIARLIEELKIWWEKTFQTKKEEPVTADIQELPTEDEGLTDMLADDEGWQEGMAMTV